MYDLESKFMYMETKFFLPYKSSHKSSHREKKKRGAGALF